MRARPFAVRRACFLGALCLVAAACAAPPPQPPSPPLAGDAGSVARGLAYARENCAACHAVGADQTQSPVPQAPAFAEVANTPGMTGTALNVWLRSPHESMPHLLIDAGHVDDLWAYMSSLQRDQR